MGDRVGLAGDGLNIQLVYQLFSMTGHPILSGWYSQISQIWTEYSIGVSIVEPDRPSNIERVVLLDQLNSI